MLLALARRRPAQAERLKEIASIQGVRTNQLLGYGLMVGLDGTGDQTTQAPFTAQSMQSLLSQLGIQLPPGITPQLRNSAAVMVTAQLPAFAQSGQLLDVTVSSIGNSKSLRGGTLLLTPLRGADGQVYAMAQGNLVVGGAGASAGGSKVQINHLSAGRIPGGATVERIVPNQVLAGDSIQIELNQTDFGNARAVTDAINRRLAASGASGQQMASARDARVIQVPMPADPEPPRRLPGGTREPRRDARRGGRQGDRQCQDRLGGDEPGGVADAERGRPRQPVGDGVVDAVGQPAGSRSLKVPPSWPKRLTSRSARRAGR